jgi:hypothetical protein
MVEHVSGRTIPHNADNTARIYEDKHGRLWVTHTELLECEYVNLEDFDVVYLNGRFYELQAHIRESDSWWVEEIETEEESEQAPETPEGEPA